MSAYSTNTERNRNIYSPRSTKVNNLTTIEDLKCYNCYNKDIMNSISPIRKVNENQNNDLNFNEKMNQINKLRIDETVERRMYMTARVSKDLISNRSMSKDDFVRNNELKTSMIDDRKDHGIARAKAKYNKNEFVISNILSKMIITENPKVTQYYKSYVKYII